MIILEGMDGTGKSTLAKRMILPVLHPGAPPKTVALEKLFFMDQQNKAELPIIYDRVTCISQQVYRKRMFDKYYIDPLNRLIQSARVVVVYCRPPDEVVLNIDNHTVSEHDTPEMLQLVKDNAALFLESYDKLMEKIPHFKYDFTNCNEHQFTDMMVEILPTQYDNNRWSLWITKQKEMQTLS